MSIVISGADRIHPALTLGIRAQPAAVGVFGAVVAVVLGVMFVGQHTGTGLDRRVAAGLALPQTFSSPAYALSWFVETLMDPIPGLILVVLLAAACLWWGRRRLAVLAVAGPAAVHMVVLVAKHLVGRTIHGGSLAYPSTHTAHCAASAMVAALLAADLLDLDGAAAAALVLGSGAVGALMMAGH